MNRVINLLDKHIKNKTKFGLSYTGQLDEIIYNYLVYMKKTCVGIKYNVIKSKEYKEKYQYLSNSEKNALKKIEKNLKEGLGIERYLSKRARNHDKDALFNNTNILHCHLSNKKALNHSELNERTRNVLFLLITYNTIYFINVDDHNYRSNKYVWVNDDNIKIIYNNWPNILNEIIVDTDFNKNQKMKKSLSLRKRAKLRSNNINYMPVVLDKDKIKDKIRYMVPKNYGVITTGKNIKWQISKSCYLSKLQQKINIYLIKYGNIIDIKFNIEYPILKSYLKFKKISCIYKLDFRELL